MTFADGTHGNPRIEFSGGLATFTTFAAQTRDVTVHWTYTGSPVRLQRFVVHGLFDVSTRRGLRRGRDDVLGQARRVVRVRAVRRSGRLEPRPPAPTVKVGGTVPPFLALAVAGPVSLGTFTPGVRRPTPRR